MQKGKQHNTGSASMRTSSFLQLSRVVQCFVAFFLAFSLFPTYAFAADSNQVLTTGSATSTSSAGASVKSTYAAAGGATTQASASPVVVETITLGTEPLNLIQNGNYNPTLTPAVASAYATSTLASSPTAAQRNQMKARLNTALMNVSASTYNGQSDWCIVSVADIKAPLSTSATAYVGALVEEVINENPDLFYAGASYGAGATKSSQPVLTAIYVRYKYSPSTIKNTMKPKYETAMQTILDWVNASKSYKNSTDAEKAKAVHDWLVRNCKYNWSAYEQKQCNNDQCSYYKTNKKRYRIANAAQEKCPHCKSKLIQGPNVYGAWNPWSAYGAVVDKSPVCEGYSLAFMAAMSRLGIQATFVTNAGHGWNRVRLKVGNAYYWYNLDITYDDPLKAGNNYADGGYNTTPSTKYFLKSDAVFKKLDTTHAKWTPAGTAGTNTAFDAAWAGGVYPLSNNTHTVKSVSLSPATVQLKPNASTKISLKVEGTNVVAGMAKWTSSNTSVATVSADGTVTSGTTQGTVTITVTLGGKTAKCTVAVNNFTSATVIRAATTYGYKSGVAYPLPSTRATWLTLKVDGTTLKYGTDYTITWPSDMINPGVKTVTITGKGKYNGGTITTTYNITCPLSKVSKSASSFTVTYNGSAQKKVPTLTFSGSANYKYTLKEGTDFTVAYPSDMTNAGTKKVTITGKGAWTGTYTYNVVIKGAAISSASITYDATKRYTGKAITQSPVVKVGSTTCSNSNYTITYKNNVKVGTATMTLTGKNSLSGSVSKTFKIVQNATWSRLWGNKAADTMQVIANSFGSAKYAVVTTDANYHDALAASALAGSLGGLVLETNKSNLSAQTKSALTKAGVNTVYLLGSTSDVSDKVKNQIQAIASVKTVKRIAASGVSNKSIASAKTISTSVRSDTVIIACSAGFQDALSVSSFSYSSVSPIIFTETNKKLSSAAVNYIKSAGFKKAVIVGGPKVVDPGVETQLKNAGISASNHVRLAGVNCYNTSRIIAEWATGNLKNGTGGGSKSNFYYYSFIRFQPSYKMSFRTLGVTHAKNWQDAISASALCGKKNAMILLIDELNTSNINPVIKAHRLEIVEGYVFGGAKVVLPKTYNQITAAAK